MWLLIIIVTAVGLKPHEGLLNTFTSLEECKVERIRIDAAMLASYPDEPKDWTLECRLDKHAT